MKYYLSSYKIGDKAEQLLEMLGDNTKVAVIFNALDFTYADPIRRDSGIQSDILALQDIGVEAEKLDLKDYFGKTPELKERLQDFGGVWIMGGNVYILRQAMSLSGLDIILKELDRQNGQFVYAGYSAAGCVLSSDLKPYGIVDDTNDFPYKDAQEIQWNGLGLIDYTFIPHFQSDHDESDDINKTVQYCKDKDINYKTLKDGEVLVIE